MGEVTFRRPEQADIGKLLVSMRELDLQEIIAASGPDPWETLRRSLAYSTSAVAADLDGRLLALFGLAPVGMLSDTASPWCLATPALETKAGMLTRVARGYFRAAQRDYPRLVNYVDARNLPSIAWLKIMGFTLSPEPVPFGWAQLPFYRFEMGA